MSRSATDLGNEGSNLRFASSRSEVAHEDLRLGRSGVGGDRQDLGRDPLGDVGLTAVFADLGGTTSLTTTVWPKRWKVTVVVPGRVCP